MIDSDKEWYQRDHDMAKKPSQIYKLHFIDKNLQNTKVNNLKILKRAFVRPEILGAPDRVIADSSMSQFITLIRVLYSQFQSMDILGALVLNKDAEDPASIGVIRQFSSAVPYDLGFSASNVANGNGHIPVAV